MGTMYDSDDPTEIPPDAAIVAAYIDGPDPTIQRVNARFPNAQMVTITLNGNKPAMVCDVENGAASVADGVRWAQSELNAGRRPCLYYSWGKNGANADAMAGALWAALINPSHVDHWVADWTGVAHLRPGTVATQWASPSTGSPGHYDISTTAEGWPPAPTPAPTSSSIVKGDNMDSVTVEVTGNTRHVYVKNENGSVTHWWQPVTPAMVPGESTWSGPELLENPAGP